MRLLAPFELPAPPSNADDYEQSDTCKGKLNPPASRQSLSKSVVLDETRRAHADVVDPLGLTQVHLAFGEGLQQFRSGTPYAFGIGVSSVQQNAPAGLDKEIPFAFG